VAPNRVNFHLEHHLLMTVPHYNLPRLHRMLTERGALADACIDIGYPTVLGRAASRPPF
jgi:fatty acid desaturase